MQTRQTRNLIEIFFKNDYSKKTQRKFRKWLVQPRDAKEKEEALLEIWREVTAQTDENTLSDLQQVHRRIDAQSRKRSINLHTLMRVAAVVLLLFFTYYLTQRYAVDSVNLVECFVPNGEARYITLPDSSKVWVNAGSMLIYPDRFTSNTRNVFLSGEAYFSVAKRQGKRFVVTTQNFTVEAVGTVFNVQDYPDLNQAVATLEEGVVKVDTKSSAHHSVTLKPDQQIIYNPKTNNFTLKTIDASRAAMWRDGYLVFQEASFAEILHALEKRFNVAVQFDAGKYEGRTFTVRFFPNETLAQTLEILQEIITDFRFTIKDDVLYIY